MKITNPNKTSIKQNIPHLVLHFNLFVFSNQTQIKTAAIVNTTTTRASFIGFPLEVISECTPLETEALSIVSTVTPSPFSEVHLNDSIAFSITFFQSFSSLFL